MQPLNIGLDKELIGPLNIRSSSTRLLVCLMFYISLLHLRIKVVLGPWL